MQYAGAVNDIQIVNIWKHVIVRWQYGLEDLEFYFRQWQENLSPL